MIRESRLNQESRWALDEFGGANFGDQRLTERLIKIADNLAELPESSINQACGSWPEAKAAYRFFQNENILESEILATHVQRTIERASKHKTILVIQDTSYISYTSHKKTTGLGIISCKPGIMYANGIVMHTALAVTTEGLPLGILDQKVHARPPISKRVKKAKERSHNNAVPIEAKESIRWLDSLKKSDKALEATERQVVTICDREGDIYDLFELAHSINSSVLIRAARNRDVNRSSKYPTKDNKCKLWNLIQKLPCQGEIQIEIPARDNKPSRKVALEVRFGAFEMNPPRNNFRHKEEELPNLKLNAVYVIEKNTPAGESPLEWMLLTNLAIKSTDEALEKIQWYCLRWRVEVFHKILKSGLKIEECRLGTAKRLMRYLTVMSVIAWRIFFITLIARTSPDLPCTILLSDEEWKVLYLKVKRIKSCPQIPPPIKDAVRWIAQLGGFLARKQDKDPGPIALWRGWKRLFDLADGWSIATSIHTYG